MIYSVDDVKRILDEIWTKLSLDIHEGGPCFFYKNDHIPPKVVTDIDIAEVLNEIKGKL
jgi:hypothetical protein